MLAKRLFKCDSEAKLTKEQKAQLTQERHARATWRIDRDTAVKSIFLTKCQQLVQKQAGHQPVCSACLLLRYDTSLKHALNKAYARPETRKYIRDDLEEDDLYHAARRESPHLDLAATSLEKASKMGDREFFHVFAAKGAGGFFDGNELFKGLLKAVAIRTERTQAGKGTTGMRFQSYFDDFVMTLTAMSPKSASFFIKNFAGRSLRSQRHIQIVTGMQLLDGVCKENFTRILKAIQVLGYDGPLALASDETKCTQSLRVYNNCIVGSYDGDIEFTSTEDLTKKCTDLISKEKLSSKVGLVLYLYFFESVLIR